VTGLAGQTECLFECGYLPLNSLAQRRIAVAWSGPSRLLRVEYREIQRWRVEVAPLFWAEFAGRPLLAAPLSVHFLNAANQPISFAELQPGMTVRAVTGLATLLSKRERAGTSTVYRPIWAERSASCYLLTEIGPLVGTDH
jgi:hypothetical protein